MNRAELGMKISKECCQDLTYTPWGSLTRFFDRKLLSQEPLLSQVATAMAVLIPTESALLVGISNGGTNLTKKILAITQSDGFILTKGKDGHLSKPSVVLPGKRGVFLIDDTLCRGSRAREAIIMLNNIGMEVKGIFCIVLWGKTKLFRFTERNISVFSLFSGEELITTNHLKIT